MQSSCVIHWLQTTINAVVRPAGCPRSAACSRSRSTLNPRIGEESNQFLVHRVDVFVTLRALRVLREDCFWKARLPTGPAQEHELGVCSLLHWTRPRWCRVRMVPMGVHHFLQRILDIRLFVPQAPEVDNPWPTRIAIQQALENCSAELAIPTLRLSIKHQNTIMVTLHHQSPKP